MTVDGETICSVNLAQVLEDCSFVGMQTIIGLFSCSVTAFGRRGPAPAVLANVGYTCGLIAFAFTPSEVRCVAHSALRPAAEEEESSLTNDCSVTLSGDTLGFGLKTT